MAVESRGLDAVWYGSKPPGLGLRALELCYALLAPLHRAAGRLLATHPGVPVVVVGNLTAGGAGKTPLVIRLVELATAGGLRAGVVSRGYRSRAGTGPRFVETSSSAEAVGDEPLLIRRKTGVPVAVGSKRVGAARALSARHRLDLIVSDDGLQHLRLKRDMEIVVIDGMRGFGNRRLLPAGPLRERPERLKSVDYVVINGGPADRGQVAMTLELEPAISLVGGRTRPLAEFRGAPVVALAGIGHPERYFRALEQRGLRLERRAFPDHHAYQASDLAGCGDRPVLMTEKDAVKLGGFAGANCWAVPVRARLPEEFEHELSARFTALAQARRGAA